MDEHKQIKACDTIFGKRYWGTKSIARIINHRFRAART
jgi:hypothetical protein